MNLEAQSCRKGGGSKIALEIGVGLSTKKDSREAAREALSLVRGSLSGRRPGIVFAFASFTAFDHAVLVGELKAGLPDSGLVGCTTAGEIFNDQSVDNSLVLLALAASEISFYPCIAEGLTKEPHQTALNLASRVRDGLPDLKLLFISGSSLAIQGDVVLEALGDKLGPNLPIVGGNSGDDLTLKGGYVFLNEKMYSDALLGVAIGGDFSFGVGVAYGWKPIGVGMKITKIEGTRIYEINGKPARQVYEDYFGERAKELVDPAQVLSLLYPLGRERPDYPECLIRTPVIFHPDGSVEMGGAFAQGDEVKIMLGDVRSIIEAAGESARMAKQDISPQKTKVGVVFDCISRKRVLGGARRAEEVAALRQEFGADVPLIGFYTYGEYAPLRGDSGRPFACYHNQSLVTLALGEET